jgi:LacI family transcriptional regulator
MPTLADVAVRAGVSKAAASYVLGARPAPAKLGVDTRRRILTAARDLGYRPNPIATALSTGRTRIIGLLIHSPLDVLTHPNGAWSFGAMMSAAARHGYRVMVLNPGPGPALDVRTMDACVVLGWIDAVLLDQVREMTGRITVVTTHHDIPGAIHIAQTHDAAARESHRRAAEYLFDQGHRHLAVVDLIGSTLPASGLFRAVAAERGLQVRIDAFSDRWNVRTYPTTEDICRLAPLPTAVFALDDDYARMLISRLGRMGLRVPEDLSVFSGETHRTGVQTLPPLTGMDRRYERMYEDLFEKTAAILDGKLAARDFTLDAPRIELVERESCAPPSERRHPLP